MPPPREPRSPRFAPRVTLVLVGGVALFFAVALLYSLPVLLEPPPEGAPANYVSERVREHLRGKIPYLFGGSLVAVALLVSRGGRR
ncbi:MAG TPA: hypothetical protein VEI82_12970 [Myxococcota bacterium]|nr:hypothetical protein [Myxococcota bacterium]